MRSTSRASLGWLAVYAVAITLSGCGSSDSGGGSTTVASGGPGAPPPPPSASAPSAPAGGASSASAGSSMGPMGAGYNPMGSGYNPMGTGNLETMPGDPMSDYQPDYGNPDGTTGYPGGPGGIGNPMGPGYNPDGTSGDYGYPGADGAYGRPAPPPKPKTIRDKALDAFRAGNEDEGFDLFAVHYLTSPSAGSDLARNMQWSPGLRRPTLFTRFGVAVIYSSPFNWEGDPQPVGSPELEAALGALEKQNAGSGERKGSRRIGANRRKSRQNQGGGGAPPPNLGASGEFGPGMGSGNQQQAETPQQEFEYFTGEVGAQLLAKLKTKMETGAFGAVLRDANKAVPVVAPRPAGAMGEGFAGGPMGPGDVRSGPPPGFPMPGDAGGAPDGFGEEGNAGGAAAATGEDSGQLLPGVTFLGAVENVKELGEVVATYPQLDVIFVFDVQVRPATASNWVNNNTRLRIVPAAKVTEPFFTSAVINNKGVYEARKKKGEKDPVNAEITEAIAALENGTSESQPYKLAPLPTAVTPEVALKRVQALAATNPENAVPMLVEARYYVAKKLLKREEMMSVVMTAVTEDQLAGVSELLEGADVKEKIGVALQGGERPKTVMGRFGDALLGAGGLSNLVPVPELPPIGMPGAVPALAPGAARPGAGPAAGPGGRPNPSGQPPGYPTGSPPGGRPPRGLPGSSEGP